MEGLTGYRYAEGLIMDSCYNHTFQFRQRLCWKMTTAERGGRSTDDATPGKKTKLWRKMYNGPTLLYDVIA